MGVDSSLEIVVAVKKERRKQVLSLKTAPTALALRLLDLAASRGCMAFGLEAMAFALGILEEGVPRYGGG
jgi:hypothetical protein